MKQTYLIVLAALFVGILFGYYSTNNKNLGGISIPFNRVSTSASSTVGTTAVEVLSANTGRIYAVFTNDGSDDVYLNLGATTTSAVGMGIRLNAGGGSYEINDLNLYTGEVSAISESAGINLCVTEK